jgi:hypothetical protein
MVKVNRVLALLSLIVLGAGGGAMLACGGAAESSQTTPGTTPTEVTNPETGIKVNATIASASLGGGGFGGGSSANVQIAFIASDATAPASVSISKVVLDHCTTYCDADGCSLSSSSTSLKVLSTSGRASVWATWHCSQK